MLLIDLGVLPAMPTEIERKFLVIGDSWRDAVESETRIMQGYLANNQNATVRVRVAGAGLAHHQGHGAGGEPQ